MLCILQVLVLCGKEDSVFDEYYGVVTPVES
jgi:hypothetical protein